MAKSVERCAASADYDSLFPDDPHFPSLAYQAHENVPIRIPWTKRTVSLGLGFDTTCTGIQQDPFRPSPFLPLRHISSSSLTNQVNLMWETNSSFRSTSSSEAATSYEHMNISGNVSVGDSFLGATGRVSYMKDVQADRNVSALADLRIILH